MAGEGEALVWVPELKLEMMSVKSLEGEVDGLTGGGTEVEKKMWSGSSCDHRHGSAELGAVAGHEGGCCSPGPCWTGLGRGPGGGLG